MTSSAGTVAIFVLWIVVVVAVNVAAVAAVAVAVAVVVAVVDFHLVVVLAGAGPRRLTGCLPGMLTVTFLLRKPCPPISELHPGVIALSGSCKIRC